MKKYFSRITQDYWTLKNNAHKQAREVAWDMDRRIIDESQVEDFKKEIESRIDAINLANKRCNDLELYMPTKCNNGLDFYFSIPGNFNLYLFQAK